MTSKEAIQKVINTAYYSVDKEAIDTLQELVDKATPMKPDTGRQLYDDFNHFHTFHACRNCNKPVWKFEKYCANCGQKLDWSDVE